MTCFHSISISSRTPRGRFSLCAAQLGVLLSPFSLSYFAVQNIVTLSVNRVVVNIILKSNTQSYLVEDVVVRVFSLTSRIYIALFQSGWSGNGKLRRFLTILAAARRSFAISCFCSSHQARVFCFSSAAHLIAF